MTVTTQGAAETAIAQHSSDPFLIRLTIDHDTLVAPIYIVRNRENIVTGDGREFVAYPFNIEPPNDDDQQPQARISVANVDRAVGLALEGLITPADFTIEIFLASDPDTVECVYDEMSMTNASWNFQTVTMTIQRIGYWDEPWPKKRLTPSKFPGMFP